MTWCTCLRGAWLPVFIALCLLPIRSEAADADNRQIARLIFHNECNARIACLTSWNRGEGFASLGIGHFIWYPAGTPEADKPFAESFPALLAFMRTRGVSIPDWLVAARGCPWPDRTSFIAAQQTARMQQLRSLLEQNMPAQAAFMHRRLDAALPSILTAVPATAREQVRRQYRRVADAPMGAYALTDYVNFKGEGVRPGERYRGKGWGLMQVLACMRGDTPGLAAIREFAACADAMLTRRVSNAPAARHEARWLPGWRKRLASYVREARKASARSAP